MKIGISKRPSEHKIVQLTQTGNFVFFNPQTNNFMYIRYYNYIQFGYKNFACSLLIYNHECVRLNNEKNRI